MIIDNEPVAWLASDDTFWLHQGDDSDIPLYTAEQLEIAIEATKEKAAKLLESGVLGHGECAAAIRRMK